MMFLASFSEAITLKTSPAATQSSRPKTSTGVDGPASLIVSPELLMSDFIFPFFSAATTMSPTFKTPFCTKKVPSGPLNRSSSDSNITPVAFPSTGALSSRSSDSSTIASKSESMPSFEIAETGII